jgi:hypothetical protein
VSVGSRWLWRRGEMGGQANVLVDPVTGQRRKLVLDRRDVVDLDAESRRRRRCAPLRDRGVASVEDRRHVAWEGQRGLLIQDCGRSRIRRLSACLHGCSGLRISRGVVTWYERRATGIVVRAYLAHVRRTRSWFLRCRSDDFTVAVAGQRVWVTVEATALLTGRLPI